MYPYLQIGPLNLQLPALAILAGIWIGMLLAEKEARRLNLPPEKINNLIFIGLAAGLLGARLAYAARYLNVYLENPLGLLALNVSTLSAFEGLLIGVTAAFLYAWRNKLPLRRTLDALTPALAVFMVFQGIAHFLSGNAYGAAVKLPWSIYLWNDYRHPSQVYEILLASLILFIVLKKPFGHRPPGQNHEGVNFLLFVALSAAARVFLEAFRGDSLIWQGGFRAAQVIGLIILALALWGIKRWSNPAQPEATAQEEEHSQ
jgi:phosphatidylglycerol:prolipoprotein diacylglycerol transferase